MKKAAQIFIQFLLALSVLYAQSNSCKLNMKMTIVSDSQSVVINYSGAPDETIEGYYLSSRYPDIYTPSAALRKGGFSFLDDEIFGGMVKTLAEKWVKNNFPITDVAPLTNGISPAKVLSFKIRSVIIDEKSDTLNLLVKYAVLEYQKNKYGKLDFTPRVQLFYKLLKVEYNKRTELKIFDELFPEHKFTAQFWRSGNDPFEIKVNENMFDAVKESANESEIGDADFSFDVELIRTDENDKFKFKYIAKHQGLNLPSAETIVNLNNGEKTKLPTKIYYGKLQFPFVLYNKIKEKRYASYKTKEKIFQSSYDFIIVPIKLNADSLIFDLFLNYSKLNLEDGISRWTPIKKRITIAREWAFAEIKLPKENWSANFIRGGERYDIYGFSDVESYIDERVRIKFKLLGMEAQ